MEPMRLSASPHIHRKTTAAAGCHMRTEPLVRLHTERHKPDRPDGAGDRVTPVGPAHQDPVG